MQPAPGLQNETLPKKKKRQDKPRLLPSLSTTEAGGSFFSFQSEPLLFLSPKEVAAAVAPLLSVCMCVYKCVYLCVCMPAPPPSLSLSSPSPSPLPFHNPLNKYPNSLCMTCLSLCLSPAMWLPPQDQPPSETCDMISCCVHPSFSPHRTPCPCAIPAWNSWSAAATWGTVPSLPGTVCSRNPLPAAWPH